MRLKSNKKNKTENISFRLSEEDKNKLQTKANLYTEGNLSEYLIYVGLKFVASKSDLEEDKKSPSKRRARGKKN